MSKKSSYVPSHRDLQIFRRAEIQGLTHQQIASACKLTRRRVSQIVQRVSHWLSQNSCEDPQIATELERNRLGQHIERMRLEDVIWRARMALTAAPKNLTTTTTKADGSKITSRRELPPVDVQLLKTYLRSIQALGKFDREPEVPFPPPAEGEFPWATEVMNEVLTRWSHRIWDRKLKTEHFYQFGEDLIGAFVNALKNREGDSRDGEAPAEPPTTTGSVSEGSAPVPTASASEPLDVRRGSPDPSATPTEGLSSTTADNAPNLSFILPPSSFSITSRASQISPREAPLSENPANGADALTPSDAATCVPSPPHKSSPRPTPTSQENSKREAPHPPTPYSTLPTLLPSYDPLFDPWSRAT